MPDEPHYSDDERAEMAEEAKRAMRRAVESWSHAEIPNQAAIVFLTFKEFSKLYADAAYGRLVRRQEP